MPKAPSELPESQVSPDPKQERRTRRQFTTEYKLQIIAEADQCQRGEVGQLLRREGLYSSQLNQWRRERAAGGPEGLAKSAPGPVASTTPEQRRIEQLEKENAKLSKRLQTAEACIDLQKNVVTARSREQWELCVNQVVTQRPEGLSVTAACRALGLNRSTVYARQREGLSEEQRAANCSRKECVQPRALNAEERQRARDVLYSEAYQDQPPDEIYCDLLEQGEYIGSVRTLYRILAEDRATRERRNQRPAQHHTIPRLLATAPNQVWTWDISKLPTTGPGPYLSLYVVMDLYSRYVLAWMVSRKENSTLAQQLMSEAAARYAIAQGSLTLHQDRGAPMTAHGYLDLMHELGIVCSHGRPRTSEDNAFSEGQFKTLKYQPDYPGRFENASHARQWCEAYFDWYNFQHHHSGIGGYTPEQVFTGRFELVHAQRQQVLDTQYRRHPERFVQGAPVAPRPPE